MPRVLVVDDERNIALVIQTILERSGIEAVVRHTGLEALEYLEREDVQAVITDLYMPGVGGMEILEACQRDYPQLPVVMITAHGTVESAVAALKRGAFDYITKPFDQKDLLSIVQKAIQTYSLRIQEPVSLIDAASEQVESLVGASPQMQEVFRVITKVAKSPSTVLIRGESGTGKELVAFEIHRRSNRVDNAFIKLNCAAIPATLIESELFGYEKGAFTGAVGSKPGRFELADKGTLFLDEVGEMGLEMQAKLLRVLQEQEFERVGGVETIHVDVRILAATNRDLEADVKSGRFREDLFYRLNVVPVTLPPLRERGDDLEPLIRHFISKFNVKLGRTISQIEPNALLGLKKFSWPGNIRQLENALERMVLMSEGDILRVSDLPEEVRIETGVAISAQTLDTAVAGGSDKMSFKDLVRSQTQAIEKELIERALAELDGNITRTADKLGLSRKGLQLKMKELGVTKDAGGAKP